MAEAGLTALTGAIYDAVLDDAYLPSVAQGVAEIAGAHSSTLTWREPGKGAGTLSCNGLTADDMRSYDDHWYAADPWVEAGSRFPFGTALNVEDYLSINDFERTAFYNEFVRSCIRTPIVRCAGALLKNGDQIIALGVQRERSERPFEPEHIAALQATLPHFGRFFAVRRRLAEAEQERRDAWAALDRLGSPVIRADRYGRVTYANAEAERLFARHDGLVCAPSRRLGAERPEDSGPLHAAIRKACQGDGASVRIARSCGLRPLAMIAIPMPSTAIGRSGQALLFVSDPERRPSALADRLRDLFGLSEAEAAVALALATGDDLGAISEARGVKVSTLRTQLARILAKTETARQAELAALIGRMAPLV